ncbi:MAG TPA: protein kinase [Acidobacteriota bacterium]|jgi:serine/threonine protein kinase
MAPLLRTIGKYQILERLGRGGMADVYLARDTEADRQVALKLIEISRNPEVQAFLEAERRGAALQAKLCEIEPAVARIHHYGNLDGHFYIDMEYVEGEDLSDILSKGPLGCKRATEIAIRVCEVLAKAHAFITAVDEKELHGIIHGDIKPRNIRIDSAGNVRILDFGIAKGLSVTRKLTRNEFGSLPYTSPERLDTGVFDKHCDLWAVGVVLYELVSGYQPFDADTTRRMEDTIRCTKLAPLPPSICPEPLNRIIAKALASDPSRRYQSAEDFKGDLEAFAEGRQTQAETESVVDNDATRRTHGPDPEETRSFAAQTPVVIPFRNRIPPAPSRSKAVVLISSIFVGIVSIAFVLAITQEAVVWRAAVRARHELELPRSNVDRAWDEYQILASRSYLGLAPIALRRPLEQALVSEADQVISHYRNNDSSKMTKADWKQAKDYLYKASQLDPGDRELLAKYYYAEGHIQRLSHKPTAAVDAFRRAAELAPNWPDPHLGLAHTYVYGTSDLDKGEAALRRSQELGVQPGKRERAELADSYRIRGGQMWRQAEQVAGLPQEKQFLLNAKQSFQQAAEIYRSIAPWGQSTKLIKTLQENIEEIDAVLAELQEEEKIRKEN